MKLTVTSDLLFHAGLHGISHAVVKPRGQTEVAVARPEAAMPRSCLGNCLTIKLIDPICRRRAAATGSKRTARL
jgi:hypothetical protein